jgi:hypothetical protein
MKKPVAKKATHKKKAPRGSYVICSFTVPPELEEPMNAAAAARGFNRSAYICWLVQRDMLDHPGMVTPPPRPPIPSRIKRGK